MRGRREYTDYLADILDAAEKAERFAAGRGSTSSWQMTRRATP